MDKHHLLVNIIIFVSIAIVIISCERDETIQYKPIDLDPTCDTLKVDYFSIIEPIISTRCMSCHNETIQLGGVRLDNYEKISGSVKTGSFQSSLEKNMRVYLKDDCEYARLKSWINQGFKQ